jgi:hypothetical protein
MKTHAINYKQKVYDEKTGITIVFGQAQTGKRIYRYAGATIRNENDHPNQDIGEKLAEARALENLSKQIHKTAAHLDKKARRMIERNTDMSKRDIEVFKTPELNNKKWGRLEDLSDNLKEVISDVKANKLAEKLNISTDSIYLFRKNKMGWPKARLQRLAGIGRSLLEKL